MIFFCFRCEVSGYLTPPHNLPFQDEVPSNPSFEEMQEVVCVRKIRPIIPACWMDVEILQTLAKTMQVVQ